MIGESGPKENLQGDIERIEREMEKLRKRIESILDWASKKTQVETEVRRILEEMKVPFSRISVKEDDKRSDNKQSFTVDISVLNSWVNPSLKEGERLLWFRCPENTN